MRSVKALLTAMLLILTAALLPLAPAFAEDSASDEDDGGIMLLASYPTHCFYCYSASFEITYQSNCWAYSMKCLECGRTSGATVKPGTEVAHTWAETSRTEPTCIASGAVHYECSNCHATKSEEIPALGGSHTWKETSRTDASCTAAGSVSSRCSRCSETKTEAIPALGHSWTETNRKAATCTSAGSVTSRCSRCNETKTEMIPALGGSHTWKETSRTDASCTAAGSVSSRCSRCNETKTETIPALGGSHTWKETSRTDASCTAAGSVTSRCSRCGETKTETIPIPGHDWREASRENATCTTAGSIYFLCARCNRPKTEVIPPLAEDHTWVESSRTDATCTTAGSVEYGCSVCHVQKSEPLQPLGHSWAETGRVEPSCSPGSIEYTCSNCHEVRTETVPAITNEHTYEIVEVVPAVYDADGHLVTASYIVYRCAYCGDPYNAAVGGSAIGPIIDEGAGGDGMQDATAALGKTFLSGIWALFGIYVPGFSFTFGQMWLGVLLASISVLVVRMMFGFGGGSRGEATRTSSTDHPRIAKERRYDEF